MLGAKTFHLTISTVSGALYDEDAASATFPGSAGELTVLPAHEPILTTLNGGTITVRKPSGEAKEFPVESGVLECSGSRAIVLL
ncbi:hypothetical protein COU20_03905 [Candidatus Kaiserbacteria bacterium CG10_big_fil_rev_8_21_14_0_10_59_10]|uniref:ATP synthase F1 complex delta/epsilon subunit N-terminal domain-containing protein n=1 Tax=Candidatus Kaiserbacteria bacterium CG10_big_fil_rev_8_21_14_0_10_59_10 TaxID=1974612 RepID=A0A2H0U7H0_9BACT|nr:MAG: hypothetical protein COU20_03905 [Candidatus Kaiserbacteria bacterium CG10_big_fil_rev_8_21_14_0_10_59_10]